MLMPPFDVMFEGHCRCGVSRCRLCLLDVFSSIVEVCQNCCAKSARGDCFLKACIALYTLAHSSDLRIGQWVVPAENEAFRAGLRQMRDKKKVFKSINFKYLWTFCLWQVFFVSFKVETVHLIYHILNIPNLYSICIKKPEIELLLDFRAILCCFYYSHSLPWSVSCISKRRTGIVDKSFDWFAVIPLVSVLIAPRILIKSNLCLCSKAQPPATFNWSGILFASPCDFSERHM